MPKFPLLARLVVTLVATALVPLATGFYLVRTNKDVLREQVQRTHMVATRTTADRVDTWIRQYREEAQTLAEALANLPSRRDMGVVLNAAMTAQHPIVAAALYNADGQTVLSATRQDVGGDLPVTYEADAEAVRLVRGDAGRRWLRLREPLRDGETVIGELVLVVGTEDLAVMLEVLDDEFGGKVTMVLVNPERDVLFGPDPNLDAFPGAALDEALHRSEGLTLAAGAKIYLDREDQVVAYAPVRSGPWSVLSREPARVALSLERRIRQATGVAMGLALAMVAVISFVGLTTVIRPLRRVIEGQRQLAGDAAVQAGGSEIAQLEASFALLEQRVRDRESLDKISLGRYQVIEILGEGAMGTVFKGRDLRLERDLAIKTVRLHSDAEKREKLVSTLLKEARTSAKFHHPNIVTVHDADHEGAAAFIAMEFVDGMTLENLIAGQGRLEWQQVVPLAAAIARGLEAAHEHSLVHQDIKPANILLGRDHSVKVTDFGISQLISRSHPNQDEVVCGTPGYIAPESLEGEGYSPQSDLFALGVLMHECINGEHPFVAKNLRMTVMNTIYHDPPPLDRLFPEMPTELAEVVARLLEKEPAKRPASAAEVAGFCEELAGRENLVWRYEAAREVPARRDMMRTQVVSLHSTRALTRSKVAETMNSAETQFD